MPCTLKLLTHSIVPPAGDGCVPGSGGWLLHPFRGLLLPAHTPQVHDGRYAAKRGYE